MRPSSSRADRRGQRPALAVAVAALVFALSACGAPPKLSLQLVPGTDPATGETLDTSALASLVINILSDSGDADQIPIALDATKQVELSGETVEYTVPFLVDVWGCEDPASCGQDAVTFRGCTPTKKDFSKLTGTIAVKIEMYLVDDPRNDVCPSF